MRIHGAMMTQNELPDLIANVERLLVVCDTVTVVDGGSTDATIPYMRNWAQRTEALRFFIHPWEDNFPKQRNNYLRRVGEIAEQGDWVISVDPDEILDRASLTWLKANIGAVSDNGVGLVKVRCRSVSYAGPDRVWENPDDYWKALVYRISAAGPYYTYDGDQPVHERLAGVRGLTIDSGCSPLIRETLWYEHRKQQDVIWWRGVRNYFAGGGGPNLGVKNPFWVEMRARAKETLGITTWRDMLAYLLKGDIEPWLKSWIIEHRLDTGWDGSSEQREWYKFYFRMLHPEEEPAELQGESIP